MVLLPGARVSPGDVVVTTAGTYPTVKYFAAGVGAELVEVPYADDSATGQYSVDLSALCQAAVSCNASAVYVANPDNPTGHVHKPEDIETLRSSLPAHTTLIVDEAYVDFAREMGVKRRLPNTVQLRTMSKAYAMAGLRIGYWLSEEEWVKKADQIRTQYAINNLSVHVAEMLIADADFGPKLLAETVRLRDELSAALRSRGMLVLPSATNFVMVRYGSDEEVARP